MRMLKKMLDEPRPMARFGLLVVLVALSVGRSPLAHADMMLLASTDLVYGSSAATFSFDAPTSGTVTAQISSLPWPVPLSALSFSATTATDTLSSWSSSAPMSGPQTETFTVGAGSYFAHVMATAGGSLDLGLYSLMLTFTPTVPLPASDWMLVIGVLVLFGLTRVMSAFGPFEGLRRSGSLEGALQSR